MPDFLRLTFFDGRALYVRPANIVWFGLAVIDTDRRTLVCNGVEFLIRETPEQIAELLELPKREPWQS